MLAIAGPVTICGQTPSAIPNAECQKCHGDANLPNTRPGVLASMVRGVEGEPRLLRSESDTAGLYVDGEALHDSAHAGISCTQCHLGIERLPHRQRLATLSCADCHAEEGKLVAETPHGGGADKGGLKLPGCTDCHSAPHEVARVPEQRTFEAVVGIVETCSSCHGNEAPDEASPGKSFHDNIHGHGLFKKGLVSAPSCADCHGYHKVLPKESPESAMHPSKVPGTCGECHKGVEDTYLASVHGKNLMSGREDAATCTSCHKGHESPKVGDELLSSVYKECSQCHADLAVSYLRSYHGKATELGDHAVAVCSSCHGAHDILPSSDPASRVAPENLVATCGECHEGSNEKFVQYIAHIDYLDSKKHPQVFWTFVFMTTLLLGTLAVFIPHTLLWFQRTLVERIMRPPGAHHAHKTGRMVQRFNWVHRITHGMIVISFMGLVATGFPLKYSYAGWAHNLTAAFGGIQAMGILHRGFALLTFAYVALHLGFLGYFFIAKCPRPIWKYLLGPESLVFSWRDVKDFFAMVRWFFWLGPRPRFERWTYFEKFDYWGEIWGVIIIGGSGLILWWPTFFTQWLPGWIINCAMVMHSIEALLAASVIFLVHFFNTHLRPEKFPVDMVMLTGQMPEEEMIEERGAEYDRLRDQGRLEELVVPPVERKWRIIGAIMGVMAFLTGIMLIVVALWTEFNHLAL